MTGLLLCAVLELTGVVGDHLRSRAFFDANNVKVGDPLVLTLDFLGDDALKALHPPALSQAVSRRDWKVDDISARTATYPDGRRLTYRLRPMREGVLWFPAIEFGYVSRDGARRTVRSNAIPVHAKGGAQVVVEGLEEDSSKLPSPPELVTDPAAFAPEPVRLSGDAHFAWRRACAKPTADAFAAFDFAAAKLNEATCAIREGNWARALNVYSRLEWRIGQTPEIERGIVAALALRYENPAVELPVWRQVGRPLLRFAWPLRIGVTVGALALLALVFWLVGRAIRAVACLALAVALVQPASAQGFDPRAMMDQLQRESEQMMRRMQSMSSGFSFHFGEKEERPPVQIAVRLDPPAKPLHACERFDLVLSLEFPANCSVGQVRLTPSVSDGLTYVGEVENLPDGKSAHPENVVRRLSVPVRFDKPYTGPFKVAVEGMVTCRRGSGRGGGFFSFTYSNSFASETPVLALDVRPLPKEGQPADFGGIVAEDLRVHELLDLMKVETNDVIQVTYRMFTKGYVPQDFLPPDSAYEMGRNADEGLIEYRRYFVADGTNATPRISIPYYDPRKKAYRRAETGGTHVLYK